MKVKKKRVDFNPVGASKGTRARQDWLYIFVLIHENVL